MIKYCCNCVYPETKPDLTFDEDGVCDACRFSNVKDTTDWDSRRKELVEIFDKFKNKDGKGFNSNVKGTFEYMAELLNKADELIGKEATVKYFNLTPDGVPRFPYVIAIRDYE